MLYWFKCLNEHLKSIIKVCDTKKELIFVRLIYLILLYSSKRNVSLDLNVIRQIYRRTMLSNGNG